MDLSTEPKGEEASASTSASSGQAAAAAAAPGASAVPAAAAVEEPKGDERKLPQELEQFVQEGSAA